MNEMDAQDIADEAEADQARAAFSAYSKEQLIGMIAQLELSRRELLAALAQRDARIATVQRLASMWQDSILVPRQECGDDLIAALYGPL